MSPELVLRTVWALALSAVALGAAACGRATGPQAANQAVPATPTFNKDVAPILYANCVTCHRIGQHAVPFPLMTYADVKPRAERIVRATGERRMPPWMPDPVDPHFLGERRLADTQIAILQQWVKTGAPEGSQADLPEPPKFVEGWQLGKPDLVVTLDKPYTLEPEGHDVFRNVVIRVPIPADRFIRAVEFDPKHAPIHHAIVRVDETDGSRRLDGQDGKPGFTGMVALDVKSPNGHFIGWAPGRGPILTPDDLPWRLVQGADFVVELHLLPGRAAVPIKPEIALYFAEKPAAREPVMVIMGSKAIEIPAGSRDYAIEDSYVLPVDADLLSLYPHAHYLGKDMRVEATFPDGRQKTLLHIGNWSFHWQQDYRYSQRIPLPRGTRISMRFSYDNSAENRNNPSKPPRLVTFGPQSSDEMGNLAVQVLTKSDADAAVIVRDFERKDALSNVASAEMLVRNFPTDGNHRTSLGSSYLEVGRIPEAITALEEAVRLDPDNAQAHNFLAGALFSARRVDEAVVHARRATTLRPKDPPLYYNLGRMLAAAGQTAAALRSFQQALALDPRFADAYQDIGVIYFSTGRMTEAVEQFRRAVEVAPNSARAHSDYGGVLAQVGRYADALRHVRRALEIDPSYAPARENLVKLEQVMGR